MTLKIHRTYSPKQNIIAMNKKQMTPLKVNDILCELHLEPEGLF